MANVLLTWELGGGMGHLMNLLPLARGLADRGHKLFVSARELRRTMNVLHDIDATVIPAPLKLGKGKHDIDPPRTFAHLLHNCGFGDQEELFALALAWRNLIDLTRPDLIVFDHSPAALLASRGRAMRRTHIGTGFFCPLDVYPMAELRSGEAPAGTPDSRIDEDHVLQHVNRLLISWNLEPLDRLSQLFYDGMDEHFLVTFAELDHYGQRQNVDYLGARPNVGGKAPIWPPGGELKIYAYLKPFDALPALLGTLHELGHSTLVYVDGISDAIQRKYSSPSLRFETQPLDLALTSQQCDLAILNGNHGTTVSMLLAGKPTLQIPLFLEQSLFSKKVVELGAGLAASPNSPEQIILRLIAMISTDRFTKGAQAFAKSYANYDAAGVQARMIERADGLARAAQT